MSVSRPLFTTILPSTAFAIAGKQLPLLTTPGRLIIRKVPLVEYASPGSMDLAELVAKTFSDHSVKVALLKGHRTVCVGEDIEEAIKISEWLEDAAFHAYLSLNLLRNGAFGTSSILRRRRRT
jgi:ribulose-5-phosphate 4-epimerase/fuculose-1-phosphate aldolase